MKISIIIVNYNTPDLVYSCLQSIIDHVSVPHEIILVDNASVNPPDPAKLPTDVMYLPLVRNVGFGGGNNAGSKLATGEYLWFLNSDTVLADESYSKLTDFLDHNFDYAVASPLLFLDTRCQKLQSDFYAYFQSFRTLLTRNVRPKLDLSQSFQPVDLVVGAALMIRRLRFEVIKGFDEQIFMYMEDDDLCYRAGRVAVVTGASMIHLQGSSISVDSERKRLYYASQNYFWRKHYGLSKSILMRLLRAPFVAIRRG